MTPRATFAEMADRLAALYAASPDIAATQMKNSRGFVAASGFVPMVPLHRVILGLRGRDMLAPNRSGQELARHTPAMKAAGYRPVREGEDGFEAIWLSYLECLQRLGVTSPSDGTPSARAVRVFYIPAPADRAAVLHAMARFAAGEMPPGRGNARKWFVRHPETGDYLPAKIIWGLATGLTDFNAHQARDGLRRLGFDVPGPDQPAAEIAESPESLAALPPAFEGAERQVTRNIRERDPAARRAAEAHWRILRGGLICEGCGIDFGRVYGPRGAGFMHVHHLTPLAAADGPRAVDGARDLVPLCPNCHAMVHRGEDLLTIDALRALLGLPPQQL